MTPTLNLTFLRDSFAVLGLALIGMLAVASAQVQHPRSKHPNPQLASSQIEGRVDSLLKKMTLDEKLGQLVQYNTAGTTAAGPNSGVVRPQTEQLDAMQLAEGGLVGSLLNITSAARVTAYQHAAVDKSRLHIPLLIGADVLHGYRTGYPIPLGLAASFDPELVTSLSRMSAQEATPSGIRWFYAPMVDISHDARWGRTAEGAGGDAFLGAAMARAYVHGYQGDRLNHPQSVAAAVKHFAAYGAVEAGRDYNTTDMSDSRLRQVYLPPYKAAIEAGAANRDECVQCSKRCTCHGQPLFARYHSA